MRKFYIQWYNWPYTGLNSLILDSESSEKIEKKLSIAFKKIEAKC